MKIKIKINKNWTFKRNVQPRQNTTALVGSFGGGVFEAKTKHTRKALQEQHATHSHAVERAAS